MNFIRKFSGIIKKKYYYIDASKIQRILQMWKIESNIKDYTGPAYKKNIYWIYESGVLYVMTYYPGSLIGRKGELVSAAADCFKDLNKHFRRIHIVELGCGGI